MKVKNIFTNPLHGIKPGEVGELPKNRESRINQYVKYGMIEIVEEKKHNRDRKKPKNRKKHVEDVKQAKINGNRSRLSYTLPRV